MKKALLTTFAVSLLLITLGVASCPHPVRADSADYVSFVDSGVTVFSPVNMTYNYGNLFLDVSLYSAGNLGGIDPNVSMNFSIDGTFTGSVPLKSSGEIHVLTRAIGTIALPELPDGPHVLTLFLYGLNQRTYEPKYLPFVNTVYFSTVGNPVLTPTVRPTPTLTPSPAPLPNLLLRIFILSDGSVTRPDKILRQGNVYSLTGDLDILPIVVECNNIILDGKGFSSKGMSGWSELVSINLTASNVTVKNFNIANYGLGILGAWNNNTIMNNTFRNVIKAISIYADSYTVTNNNIQNSSFFSIRILNANNNTFFENKLTDNSIGFDVANSTGNLAVANTFANNHEAFRISSGSFQVYHNNFIDQYQEVSQGGYSALVLSESFGSSLWDNGYPSGGNYYSDYLTRYPNASEVDNSGIGDVPYQVSINSNLTDRYPLLELVNTTVTIAELPSPSITPSPITLPSPTSSANSTLTPTPSVPEFPLGIILPLATATILLIVTLIKTKRSKEAKQNPS
jgi:parallel beta-helix repeat protein